MKRSKRLVDDYYMRISMCGCNDEYHMFSLELEISFATSGFIHVYVRKEDQRNHERWCGNIISVFTFYFHFW